MRLKGTPEKWLSALQGQSERRWKDATLAMGGLKPSDPVAPAPFQEALSSDDEDVVFWSIIALGGLRWKSKCAVQDLKKLTKHPAFGIRQAALGALTDIAPRDLSVKHTIFRAFADRSPWVRAEAVRQVIYLSGLTPLDLRKVKRMLSDRNEDVRYYTEITVRNIKNRKSVRGSDD